MNMADVSAVFGTLLALGIAFPGMLLAWWLLFPATVERARLRLDHSPWRCLALGGALAPLVLFPSLLLLNRAAGPGKFVGLVIIATMLIVASLGAAGLAAKMGEQLRGRSSGSLSSVGAFVRATIALELAAAFPLLGWFMVLPLLVITSLGASAFALLHWSPRISRTATSEASTRLGTTDVTPSS